MVRTRKRRLDDLQTTAIPARSKRLKLEEKTQQHSRRKSTRSTEKGSNSTKKERRSSSRKGIQKRGRNQKMGQANESEPAESDEEIISDNSVNLKTRKENLKKKPPIDSSAKENDSKENNTVKNENMSVCESSSSDFGVELSNGILSFPQSSKGDGIAVLDVPNSSISVLPSTSASENTEKKRRAESSSSESEWEDVEEVKEEVSLEDYKPEIPKEGVEITLDVPDPFKRRRKRCSFDFAEYLRLQFNRYRKDIQLSMHKVHLLCLISNGMFVNSIINGPILKALSLSVIPESFYPMCSKKFDLSSLNKLLEWFYSYFKYNIEKGPPALCEPLEATASKAFENQQLVHPSHCVFIFAAIARTLKLNVRVCFSLYPVPLKPSNLLKPKKQSSNDGYEMDSGESNSKQEEKEKSSKNSTSSEANPSTVTKNTPSDNKGQSSKTPESKNLGASGSDDKDSKKIKVSSKSRMPVKERKSKSKSSKLDLSTASTSKGSKNETSKNEISLSDEKKQYRLRPRSSKNASSQDEGATSDEGDSDSEWSMEDFVVEKKSKNYAASCKKLSVKDARSTKKSKKSSTPKNRKIVSSDSDSENEVSEVPNGIEQWAEVFVKKQDRWVCVDPVDKIVDEPYEIESHARQPLKYVVAIDNKGKVKDVTKRYASKWMTSTRKLRISEKWWSKSLKPFAPSATKQERKEEHQLNTALQEQPLPTTIGEYKSHPLYVLKRHLLKFEAIYPPDAPPLGFIRKEPVYARECVHTLRSRDTWLKEARSVKEGEAAYKMVRARPRWDKVNKRIVTDLPPLEVFGFWQTEPYVPPTAKDGKVPRNDHGNVDLYKPSMLPKGTVHLQLPGLGRIAKKLGIDCAAAFTGFESSSSRFMGLPIYDGWVVCKEYKDVLVAAWEEEQENIRKREEEKREKRVYGNWRKLIKGLLIRERLKKKYKNND